MNDDFAGNIGDYGKYGLLRALTGVCPRREPRLSLGVIWYQTSAEGQAKSRFDYLDHASRYRECDAELFDVLKNIRDKGNRSLKSIEYSELLGDVTGTSFFDEFVPSEAEPRMAWFARALEKVKHQDLVLLDPDTGLKVNRGVPSAKEASIDELRLVIDTGKVAVVYHHHEGFPMQHRSHRFAGKVKDALDHTVPPEAILFSPGRTDFFIVLPEHRRDDSINGQILERIRDLVHPGQREWARKGHFMSRLGDKTPREAFDGGLELLRDGLVGYCTSLERHLKEKYTHPWQKDVRDRINERKNRGKRNKLRLYSHLGEDGEGDYRDPVFLLDALRQFRIDGVGRRITVSDKEFDTVRKCRNSWAHYDEVDRQPVTTALSIMERVMSQTDDVPRQMRLAHLRKLFKQETP